MTKTKSQQSLKLGLNPKEQPLLLGINTAPVGDYNVKMDCLVTDFGIVKLPNSWLLHHYVKNADELSAYFGSQPAFVRYLMKDVKNPFRDTLEEYYKYVNEMQEIGYAEGKHRWHVDFLSFHDWLRQKENVIFAYKGGTGQSPSGQGESNRGNGTDGA